MTKEDIFEQIQKKQSFLCIGLDTDLQKIPSHLLNTDDPIFEFNKQIIDATHDLWVKNWLSIEIRGFDLATLSKSMIIGISSSGYSKNICTALDYAVEKGIRAWLISAKEPKINGSYNVIKLDVNEYHTSEVISLSLFYQLIHGAGFSCPTIEESVRDNTCSDYIQY